MFGHKHYVPILKWKMGEYSAVRELDPSTKSLMTPLSEIPTAAWDWVTESPSKSLGDHVAKVAETVDKNWGNGPCFLDAQLASPPGETISGVHPLTYVFDDARGKGLHLIPVTGVGRSVDYQAAVGKVIAADRHGVCIRLSSDDVDDPIFLKSELAALMKSLAVDPASVDIVIDLASIPSDQSYVLLIARSMVPVINALPHLAAWRTLTFASYSFPQSLGRFGPDSESTIIRTEWQIWMQLISLGPRLLRVPSFGDYAVNYPEETFVDPRIMRMSANLRYTLDSEWLILRGRNTRQFGFEQFRDLCSSLVMKSEFAGPSFSAGDKFIDDCAQGSTGPGNATVWRRVGTSHHLTHVSNQIANLP